jgi:hypothetical protein
VGIARVTADDVTACSVSALGFDPSATDLTTPEVLASAIRRAASFSCPISPRALREMVVESLQELTDSDDVTNDVEEMVTKLVAHGDLVEAPIEDPVSGRATRTLFLAAPAFVRISSSDVLLLGIRASGIGLLDDEHLREVQHAGHVRRLRAAENVGPALVEAGLEELPEVHWLRRPPTSTAAELASDYLVRLRAAPPAGTIDGVRVLDPSRSPSYYRGRWRPPSAKDSGRFVIRREVEFGADAWCFADIKDGFVERLIDLPVHDRLARACDEAWRLQAAIDELGGQGQRVRVSTGTSTDLVVLDFFSPLPSWTQRRLDVVGRALPKRRGSLLSYELRRETLSDELLVLRETMWIHPGPQEETV